MDYIRTRSSLTVWNVRIWGFMFTADKAVRARRTLPGSAELMSCDWVWLFCLNIFGILGARPFTAADVPDSSGGEAGFTGGAA